MTPHICVEDIIDYMTKTFGSDVCVNSNWGERAVLFNPGQVLPKGIYILTFKEHDGPNDKASNIDRPGVYRLNLGISKPAFSDFFGAVPKRPAAGGIVDTGHDFSQLDQIMPHPVYGWMAWIGVLNPGADTFASLKPLIEEAVQQARVKFKKRVGSSGRILR